MVNNPKRELTLNYSIAHVMKRLQHIGGWSGANRGITITKASINSILNTYEFQAIAFGFDFGNKGVVILQPCEKENQCKLSIEIGRVYGAIDNEPEMQLCLNQITNFLNLLSSLLVMDDTNLANYPKEEAKEGKKKKSVVLSIVKWWLIGSVALGILAIIFS
jgi:hypothetical protein